MMTILDGEKEIDIYANDGGWFIDTCVRAKDLKAWEDFALKEGFLIEDEDSTISAPGVQIDAIGPITLEPATFTKAGEVEKAAKMDDRHHVNLRLTAPFITAADEDGNPLWQEIFLRWMRGRGKVTSNNKERAKSLHSVELIDPDSISKPARVWL